MKLLNKVFKVCHEDIDLNFSLLESQKFQKWKKQQ